MGGSVHLQLRGSDLPHLAEEDEEAVAELTSKNGLPLFWMALLQADDLDGDWEAGTRAALADEDGETPIEPVRLAWTDARRNLSAAVDRAGTRLPGLAPMLREWAAGLDDLARRGPAQEARLDLAEFSNFYEDADAFLAELRRAAAAWHGDGPPDLPDASDAGRDLTGFDSRTGLPFPRAMPEWQPGRPPRHLGAAHAPGACRGVGHGGTGGRLRAWA